MAEEKKGKPLIHDDQGVKDSATARTSTARTSGRSPAP